jgi:hypothetical protein
MKMGMTSFHHEEWEINRGRSTDMPASGSLSPISHDEGPDSIAGQSM